MERNTNSTRVKDEVITGALRREAGQKGENGGGKKNLNSCTQRIILEEKESEKLTRRFSVCHRKMAGTKSALQERNVQQGFFQTQEREDRTV